MQKLNTKKTSNSEIILQKICQLTNFSYGEIWLPNDENNFLELSSDYYIVADRDRQDLEIFISSLLNNLVKVREETRRSPLKPASDTAIGGAKQCALG